MRRRQEYAKDCVAKYRTVEQQQRFLTICRRHSSPCPINEQRRRDPRFCFPRQLNKTLVEHVCCTEPLLSRRTGERKERIMNQPNNTNEPDIIFTIICFIGKLLATTPPIFFLDFDWPGGNQSPFTLPPRHVECTTKQCHTYSRKHRDTKRLQGARRNMRGSS